MPIWFVAFQSVTPSTDDGEAIVTRAVSARDWPTAGVVALIGFAVGRIVKTIVWRAAGRGTDEEAPGAAAEAEAVGRVVGFTLAAVSLVYALGVIGVRLGLLGQRPRSVAAAAPRPWPWSPPAAAARPRLERGTERPVGR